MSKKTGKNKKAVVIFIVEGNSDKKALEKIFQRIYRHKNIVFKVTDGDVTSDDNVNEMNVYDVIYEKVDECLKDKKLHWNDIWQIVHLIDTDGMYVPEWAVVQGESMKFVYSTTEIKCKSRQRVIDRNKRKCDLMKHLLEIQHIRDIPYTAFYMSSNLDHALYDMQNLDDDLKGVYADAFYSEFIDKETLFIDYLKDEVANGVPDSFYASWRYIKQDLHSLERHSNLHIYFEDNPY